jgi:hypothetical protein
MILDNGKARNYNNLHCRYEFSHKFSQIPAVGSKVVMVDIHVVAGLSIK